MIFFLNVFSRSFHIRQGIQSYSKLKETATNIKYRTNIETPRSFDIFQPEHRMHPKTRTNIVKRRMMEQPSPSLDTLIGVPNTTV